MTEYITMDLLWVLYCAFLEDKFPNASKPKKERFISVVEESLTAHLALSNQKIVRSRADWTAPDCSEEEAANAMLAADKPAANWASPRDAQGWVIGNDKG